MLVEILLMEFDWCVDVSSSGECDRRRLELDLRVLDEVDEGCVDRCFRILEEVRRPWRRRDITTRTMRCWIQQATPKKEKNLITCQSIKCGFF